ncbi:MAG TPA: hypothetical protein VE569_09025 [Acidimicrobiia bacterium]|nr:hypothetical protein [Acidimicrobiia bacterium]
MKQALVVSVLIFAACVGGDAGGTTSAPPQTMTTVPVTGTTEPPTECPAPPYELTSVPVGVGEGEIDTTVEPDVWTSVPGSSATLIPRSDNTVAIALIRGTLPPVDWPGEKGEISIDGTRAAVGPHLDGTWVAGWFEEPGERCDLYTMVFYPPWNPSDVEDVLLGMNRVGG